MSKEINLILESNNDLEIELGGEVIPTGGTNDYERLQNKPRINEVTLIGNKTSDDLGLQPSGNYANTRVTNLEIDSLF